MNQDHYAQVETLLNQAPLGVCLVDADFRIRQANPTARQLFRDIPDLIGRDLGEVIHCLWEKDCADEIVRLFRHTLDTGEPYVMPERVEERLDSAVTEYYEWRIDRMVLPDGRFGVVCYFRDISAQVWVRVALHTSQAQLETELADTKLLQSISAALIEENHVQALYERILDAAAVILHSDFASLQRFHPERGSGGELRLLGFRGLNPETAKFWEWVRADSASTCGAALRSAERIIVTDVEQCGFMAGTEDLATCHQTGIRAVQSTPLVSRSGK
ncbi:MAG TPA: PAS domain-containing protein, partial [Nitrospira sp.]|nr:PAS domain-containing protein [Nitrospira sp.]